MRNEDDPLQLTRLLHQEVPGRASIVAPEKPVSIVGQEANVGCREAEPAAPRRAHREDPLPVAPLVLGTEERPPVRDEDFFSDPKPLLDARDARHLAPPLPRLPAVARGHDYALAPEDGLGPKTDPVVGSEEHDRPVGHSESSRVDATPTVSSVVASQDAGTKDDGVHAARRRPRDVTN